MKRFPLKNASLAKISVGVGLILSVGFTSGGNEDLSLLLPGAGPFTTTPTQSKMLAAMPLHPDAIPPSREASPSSARTINFESLAQPGPGVFYTLSSYSESGFQFIPSTGYYSVWGTGDQNYPGSTALFSNNNTGAVTTLTRIGGGTFSISSIDLAPLYTTFTSSFFVTFTGILPDQSTVQQTFLVPGTNGVSTTETHFNFNSNFNNVTSVQFAQATSPGPYYQFDNVRVDPGPEALTPFRITAITRDSATGYVTIIYESSSDHLYEVRAKNNLNLNGPIAADTVLTTVIGNDGATSFVDTTTTGVVRRFYYAKRLTFYDDEDDDGLTNLDEFQRGTDINNADTDGDGLSDGTEVNTYHSDPNNPDTDGDGLTDGAEVNTYHTNPANRDTDGDGMSDGYEVANALNPLDAGDGLADPDGDRVPNLYEAANGTSPNDASSVPTPHLIVDPTIDVETETTKKTIQAAVDAAPTVTADPSRWTIIEVRPGDYAENVTIDNRHVLLLGKNIAGALPVLRGSSGLNDHYALLLLEGGVAIDGLVIQRDGTNKTYGVFIGPDANNHYTQLVNCVIRGTLAGFNDFGAAVHVDRGNVRLAHCTLTGNTSTGATPYLSKGIFVVGGAVTLENSILWDPADSFPEIVFLPNSVGTVTVHNSIVRGGYPGALNVDPLFEVLKSRFRPWNRLRNDSPAINAGAIIPYGKRDITGTLREGLPDLGAKESFSADLDNDGLTDDWEFYYFGNLDFGPDDDPDNDYANDLAEFVFHLDPNEPDTDGDGRLDGYKVDSDGDGLSDALEILNCGNIYDPDTNHDGIGDLVAYQAGISLCSDDVDGDGLTFAQEIAMGTNPFLADTDGDGVPDGLDAFPLDPTRWAAPTPDPNDHTPPEIFLDVPENAVPVP